ncbi:MAG: WYL domain-containing transcriptional regulator [Clostridia bacterium]|nr:WYL domain-containing transcriptional regulator [Clostridia bacterium]
MASTANSRTRLLCLIEILTMYSDEQNILSADEICEKLNEYGYEVTKRSVLSDIRTINTTPIKIISVSKPKKGFYLAKSYSPAASQLILEAIFSSDMLSAEDIEYIKTYLRRNICVPSLELVLNTTRNYNDLTAKRDISLEVLYNIRTAIRDRKKVALNVSRIVPGDYFSNMERLEPLIVSPLYIAVANGSIALVFIRGENTEEAEYVNISRIRSAVITDENICTISSEPEKIINFFDRRTIEYYNYKARWLIIEFRESDIEIIESFFKAPVQYRKADKEGFCIAKVYTVINRGLIGWLFMNSDKFTILAPDSLYELFKNKAKNIL